MQIKNTKTPKINSSLIQLSRNSQNGFYTEKAKNLKFLYNFLQNRKLSIFSKTHAIYCRTMSGYPACQIWGSYTYFWQTYSPKTVSVVGVIFSNCDFEYFQTSHRNKNVILRILRSNWFRNTIFVFEKNHFENLTSCDLGLTRPFPVLEFHGVRLQNGFIF